MRMKNKAFKTIIYVNTTISRKIAILPEGLVFYCSSGFNSGKKGTWLPTAYYMNKLSKPCEQILSYHKSWCLGDELRFQFTDWQRLKKSLNTQELNEVLTVLNNGIDTRLDAQHSQEELQKDLQMRFFSIASMLISAKLKGGIWDTEKGKKCLATLLTVKTFNDFYQQLPDYQWVMDDTLKTDYASQRRKPVNKVLKINFLNPWLYEHLSQRRYVLTDEPKRSYTPTKKEIWHRTASSFEHYDFISTLSSSNKMCEQSVKKAIENYEKTYRTIQKKLKHEKRIEKLWTQDMFQNTLNSFRDSVTQMKSQETIKLDLLFTPIKRLFFLKEMITKSFNSKQQRTRYLNAFPSCDRFAKLKTAISPPSAQAQLPMIRNTLLTELNHILKNMIDQKSEQLSPLFNQTLCLELIKEFSNTSPSNWSIHKFLEDRQNKTFKHPFLGHRLVSKVKKRSTILNSARKKIAPT